MGCQQPGICARAPRAALPHGRARSVFSGRVWTEPWALLRERLNSQTETPGQGEGKVRVRSREAPAPPSVPHSPHTGQTSHSLPEKRRDPQTLPLGSPVRRYCKSHTSGGASGADPAHRPLRPHVGHSEGCSFQSLLAGPRLLTGQLDFTPSPRPVPQTPPRGLLPDNPGCNQMGFGDGSLTAQMPQGARRGDCPCGGSHWKGMRGPVAAAHTRCSTQSHQGGGWVRSGALKAGVSVSVSVGVGVSVSVSVGVGVSMGVGAGIGVSVNVGVGVNMGVNVGWV